jgi:hypothetical protein
MRTPLFPLGHIVATPAALAFLQERRFSLLALLARHMRGDWGELVQEDRLANDRALAHGTRIVSSYNIGDDKVWIITEADRSCTTILMPEDY